MVGKPAKEHLESVTEKKNGAPALTLAGNAPQEYDLEAERQAVAAKLAHSQELEDLTAQIDVSDMNTIITFGRDAAEDIGRASDTALKSLTTTQLDEASRMLTALADLMAQFDPEAMKGKPSLLSRLMGKKQPSLDDTLRRYQELGSELDRIYVQLRQYEIALQKANEQLEILFQANVRSFRELEKYIVAGQQGCQEIQAYADMRTEDMRRTGEQSIRFELQTLAQAQMMLERRTQDLRMAETVALQSIPMVKMVEFSNYELMRKLDSALIVTLPVFKQALAQTILLKRKRLQEQALREVNHRAGVMTEQREKEQRETREKLESAWRTVNHGVQETREMQEKARQARMADQKRLEDLRRKG